MPTDSQSGPKIPSVRRERFHGNLAHLSRPSPCRRLQLPGGSWATPPYVTAAPRNDNGARGIRYYRCALANLFLVFGSILELPQAKRKLDWRDRDFQQLLGLFHVPGYVE